MPDESDSTDEKDTSKNNVSQDMPLLDNFIGKKDKVKDDSPQTSKTETSKTEDIPQNAYYDQIDINDILTSERVGRKLFVMVLLEK